MLNVINRVYVISSDSACCILVNLQKSMRSSKNTYFDVIVGDFLSKSLASGCEIDMNRMFSTFRFGSLI